MIFWKRNTPMGNVDPNKRRTICAHFYRRVQNVKSITGDPDDNYIINYIYCNELKRRIKKRDCFNCKLYKPL